jgi:hypothetical protein
MPKTALALVAGFVLVAAGACSSSGASSAATGGAANVNQSDPNSIISAAISGGSDIKSFHIKVAVNGTINAAALQSAAADSGIPITGDVKLDGTSLEGDVDVTNQAAHLAFNVPALAMLGNVPITGDLIVADKTLYYKVSLLGTKYSKEDLSSLGSLSSSIPVAIPSVLPTAGASGLTDEIAQLRQQMDDAGVKATLVGVDSIGGQDANHINVSIPLDKINAEIAAEASGDPSMKLDSASVDFWVYKSNNRPAKFEIKGASSSVGSLDLVVTITDYDKAVTISAPAAGDVNP